MGRRQRSRKRAIEKPLGRREIIEFEGTCTPSSCLGDVACKPLLNGTHTCVCTHDSQPPFADGTCPRNVIASGSSASDGGNDAELFRNRKGYFSINTQVIGDAELKIRDVVANWPGSSHDQTIFINSRIRARFEANEFPNFALLVDVSSGRIPVQPIASHENHLSLSSTTKLPVVAQENKTSAVIANYSSSHLFIVIPAFILVGILLFSFIYYMRRKYPRRRESSSPINLKNNFLIPERYAPNPQYTACSATGVPILKKETLSFLKEVGEGCFGKVFKGELLCDDDHLKIVAIKVLKDSANKEAEEDFLREVEIMSAFKHPNILSLLGVVLKDDNVNPMMVFEFMPHGDLAELLRSQKRSVLENEVPELKKNDLLAVASQVGKGMKYLASQRFVHRDLACRNCLVAEGPIVKIADFGMSRDVYTCDYYKIGGSRLLPVRWMSPESVVYGRFTLESDIWSYGVVLWEIFSFGKQPYYGHSNEEVVKLILDGIMLIPPEDCPSSICELMKNCWKTEPRHRITFPLICEILEEIYESAQSTKLSFESEKKKMKVGSNKSLPRPPPLPLVNDIDLLDGQGYLKPTEREPVTYLETVYD